jgi:hypothetical protein
MRDSPNRLKDDMGWNEREHEAYSLYYSYRDDPAGSWYLWGRYKAIAGEDEPRSNRTYVPRQFQELFRMGWEDYAET